MERYNKTLGKFGEDAAVKYLKKNKYTVTQRNYNIRGGEIDIIAEKGGYVIFIEVKTRSSDDYGGGAEAVTHTKQQRIIRAAQFYLMGKEDVPVRFDVIAVNGHISGRKFVTESIEHIENAF